MSAKDEVNLGYSYHMPSSGFKLQVRNSLAQFSDLFSEFNKYISPAYHHDRCERSVYMRLYGMLKRELVMVFCGMFAMITLASFIGLAGPPLTVTLNELVEHNDSVGVNTTRRQFVCKTPALSAYSQQLWVIGQIFTANTEDETFEKSFLVSLEIEGVNEDHKPVPMFRQQMWRNRSRNMRCQRLTCEEFPILHLGFLQYTHYIITTRFYGLNGFHQRYHINKIMFFFKTYEPAFTQLEIWFRFIFMMTSFIITCLFMHALRRFPVQDWALEQRWMSFLLPLLVFFNNPIFPLCFLINSSLPPILDATFQASFICGLMMFWLCAFHGLRQNDRRLGFYLPKLLIMGSMWLITVMTAIKQKLEERDDPTFNYDAQTNHFFDLKVAYVVTGVIYGAYMIILMLRACSDLRSMPFFEARLRFLIFMMLTIVSGVALLALSKFTIDSLQDNFFANLKTNYSASAEFMTFYAIINFPLYGMAYVYAPTHNAPHEAPITKDNPSFSMINDSDEDVIYGSDEDRKPLNRSRNHDDSD